jgi:hypothetical protein
MATRRPAAGGRIPGKVLGYTLGGERIMDMAAMRAYAEHVAARIASAADDAQELRTWDMLNNLRLTHLGYTGIRCRQCWLLQAHCVCGSLPPALPAIPAFADASTGASRLLRNRLKVTLLMHPSEVSVVTVAAWGVAVAASEAACRRCMPE